MSTAQDPEVERMWNEIKARPSELEPRRKLAKLLSEKGDPFGELLTLTLMSDEELGTRNREDKLAGHPYKFLGYRDARVKALVEEHGNTWFPKHPDDSFSVHPDSLRGRGIPDTLIFSSFTKEPLEKLRWFTARWPLRTLVITNKDPAPVIDMVEAGGHFARVETLTLAGNNWGPVALEALRRASPGALKVELKTPVVAPSDWSSLLSARVFAKTTSLAIVKTSLEAKALETLWAYLPKLEELSLYHAMPKANPGLGSKPLRVLKIAGPWGCNQAIALMEGLKRQSVKTLALIEEAGSQEAIRWIADEARAGRFESLEELVLQESWITDNLLKILAESVPKSLCILDLDRSRFFGEEGVAALAELANSGRCPKLEAIRMWGIFEGPGSFEEIRQRFGFPAGLKLH